MWYSCLIFFFFQAEDGIRYHCVTGVQTCALPIFRGKERGSAGGGAGMGAAARAAAEDGRSDRAPRAPDPRVSGEREIGRASCRERVYKAGAAEWSNKSE